MAFQIGLRTERKWKRPTSSPNWHQVDHTQIPHAPRISSALAPLFSLSLRQRRLNMLTSKPGPSAALLSHASKSPAELSGTPGPHLQAVCSKLNSCFWLPNLLLLPSPLLLFMAPLRLNVVMISLVPSSPLLPKYNALILLLLCLVNQLTGSVGSLCPCPS